MNSQARPRDSTDGNGANSASIVCAPPGAVLDLPAGFALDCSSFSNALVSRPRCFIRAIDCCCFSGDMLLKRSIICAGSNPRRPSGVVLDGTLDREGAAVVGAP